MPGVVQVVRTRACAAGSSPSLPLSYQGLKLTVPAPRLGFELPVLPRHTAKKEAMKFRKRTPSALL
jgi:hypothetical protein